MFVIYALNDKKATCYTPEHTEQPQGYTIAETSVIEDLDVFDCYIKEVRFDEIKQYNIVTAIESYRRNKNGIIRQSNTNS